MQEVLKSVLWGSREIVKEMKKINWLTDHLEKCKKKEDKTRLIMMITVSTVYVAALTETVTVKTRNVLDFVFPQNNRS